MEGTFKVYAACGESHYWNGSTSGDSSHPPQQEPSSSKKEETTELGGSEVSIIPRAPSTVSAASGRIWSEYSCLADTVALRGEGRGSSSSSHGPKKMDRERTVHEKKGVECKDCRKHIH